MFGRLRPPGICFREATHLNPRISVQNLCETSMFRTFRTRWLIPRGVWAWAGGAEAGSGLLGMMSSLVVDRSYCTGPGVPGKVSGVPRLAVVLREHGRAATGLGRLGQTH